VRGVRASAYAFAYALIFSACVDLGLPVDKGDASPDRPPATDAADAPLDSPADLAAEHADETPDAGVDAPDGAPPPPDAADALPSTLTGLVGYWKMDDRSAALVEDSSGLGNNGTVMGSPTLVTGASNLPGLAFPDPGAFGFGVTGQTDAVVVPDQAGSASLRPAQISISVWVKLASLAARSTCGAAPGLQQYIVHRRNTRGALGMFEGFALMKDATGPWGFLLATNNAQQDYVHGIVPAEVGTWYHVVGTFDGSVIQLYVNGSFQGAHAHPYPIDYDPTRPLFIGRTGECAPNGEGDATWDARFNGVMDDLRIYDRVLTLDEITRLSRGMN